MTAPVFSGNGLRAQFPDVLNNPPASDAQLQTWWTMGTAYLSENNAGNGWTDAQAQLGADLMAVHLASLFTAISSGSDPRIITSASEGSVSVSMQPPPGSSAFGYWLSSTPYGLQLRALLRAVAGPGMYIGGSCERAAFRKAGGVF